MDPTSLLEQLRDVHSPDTVYSPGAILTWPPAIGWIILAILISTTTIMIVWFTFRWYRSNAWRREALKEYKLLQQNYNESPSNSSLSDISSLLKRCSASINQDPKMLAITGKTWKELLEAPKSPLNDFEINLLCFGHYQAECDQLNHDALKRIRKWVKTLRPILKKDTELNLTNLDDKLENKAS
jgi:hypothetical protein